MCLLPLHHLALHSFLFVVSIRTSHSSALFFSTLFQAPELLQKQRSYGCPVDLFAAGEICVMLLTGKFELFLICLHSLPSLIDRHPVFRDTDTPLDYFNRLKEFVSSLLHSLTHSLTHSSFPLFTHTHNLSIYLSLSLSLSLSPLHHQSQ